MRCPIGEVASLFKRGGVIGLMDDVDGQSADGAAKKLGLENSGAVAADGGFRAVKENVGAGVLPDDAFGRFEIS